MAGPQRWLTFLAPAVRPLYELVASRAGIACGIDVELLDGSSYGQLATDTFDFAWVCGLPYVEVVDALIAALTPVAAPVLTGEPDRDRPAYFSDVIVPTESPATRFEDLRGCRWAYNERGSHSGYLVTLHRLATLGEDSGFFREWRDVGFHERAVRAVAAAEVDASAIDSQVLAVVLDRDPALRERVRVVDRLGPSTSQPLVAAPHVPEAARVTVRDAVVSLGATDPEQRVMTEMHVARLAPVDDADYDDIRRMLDRVRMAGLWTAPRPAGLVPADAG